MTGTLLNVGSVVVGAGIGLILGERLPERVRSTAMQALGLVVLFIGIQTALKTENVLILLASLVLGGILGSAVRIEHGLDRLGKWLETRLGNSTRSPGAPLATQPGGSRVSAAFVTSSLVFCVGPMTILGSIQDGLTGDYSTLAVKSLLDFFGAVAFASTLGPGVFLSSVVILLYQGGLTLSASFARAVLTEPMIAEMTAAGGLLILGIGLRLLEVRKVPVADLLPALLLAPALTAAFGGRLA
jgi:uncharacterized membrane protein YqgA involved in biofilm formation